MAEYIEREVARGKCCSMCRWEGTENCEECEHPIDDIPAADVVPVRHGKWMNTGTDWVCSNCGDVPWWCGVTEDVLPLYCPNCGALMDKDGDGDV